MKEFKIRRSRRSQGETLIGSIDLISDNVDLVANGRFRFALRKLYEIEA